MLSRLKTALRALLRRTQVERELDEELRYHIEQQTEQNIRLGMNPEEARYAARKAFGGVEQAKERSRDARGVRWLEDFWKRCGASCLLAHCDSARPRVNNSRHTSLLLKNNPSKRLEILALTEGS